VRDPETELRALFAWLGEPWDEHVLSFRANRSQKSGGPPKQVGVFTSSVGIGRGLASRLIALRVRRRFRPLMKELEY
jgi:hypothetical protein